MGLKVTRMQFKAQVLLRSLKACLIAKRDRIDIFFFIVSCCIFNSRLLLWQYSLSRLVFPPSIEGVVFLIQLTAVVTLPSPQIALLVFDIFQIHSRHIICLKTISQQRWWSRFSFVDCKQRMGRTNRSLCHYLQSMAREDTISKQRRNNDNNRENCTVILIHESIYNVTQRWLVPIGRIG